MKTSNAFLNASIGANLTPETANLSGSTHVGLEFQSTRPETTAVLSARLAFSAPNQTATFTAQTGALTLSPAGTAQALWLRFTGPIAPGTMEFPLTSARPGFPLAVSVPLPGTDWLDPALVAAAFRAKLASLPAVTAWFKVSGLGDTVTLTSIYGLAHDATLGIGAVVNEGGVPDIQFGSGTAGVAGVLVERQGGSGKDIFGEPWSAPAGSLTDMLTTTLAGAVTADVTARNLLAGTRIAWSAAPVDWQPSETWNGTGLGIIDVVALCQ